jgi:hypothetical protein
MVTRIARADWQVVATLPPPHCRARGNALQRNTDAGQIDAIGRVLLRECSAWE